MNCAHQTNTNPIRVSAMPSGQIDSESHTFLERGLDSSSGPGFLRERLALLAKTLCLVSCAFYLFLLASLVSLGGARFVAVVRGPVALGHPCASLTMALLWVVAVRTIPSLWSLGALHAVGFVVTGGFLSLKPADDEGQILQVLLALTLTVMGRAILLPSRPRRTLLVSASVFAPTVVVCIARHHPTTLLRGFSPGYQKLHMTLNTLLWSVLGTLLATIVSRVLYGLRQQVAEGAVHTRGADQRGRDGRGLARAPPSADSASGDQADPKAIADRGRATVSVIANTTASVGTFQLGQRPYDPNKRFDTDPNSPVRGFFGNGIPSGEDSFTLPDREPIYLERRYSDSLFVATGLAARPRVVPPSKEEALACSLKPVKCIVIYSIRNITYDLAAQAAQQDPNGIVDGQRDAYRHTIGQILAIIRLGPEEARFWGNLHETSHWANSRSNWMDLWNNSVARGTAMLFWSSGANIGESLAQNLARQADLCHQLFYVGAGLVAETTRPTLQQITSGSPGDGAYQCHWCELLL